MPRMPSSSPRGIVRAGSRISPLGVTALSDPAKAKNRTRVAAPNSPTVGTPSSRRLSRRTKKMPTQTRPTSGTSLTSVRISTIRAPCRAPRMLMAASTTNKTNRRMARGIGSITSGQAVPTVPTRAVATAASDRTPQPNHNRVLTKKPAMGPNAAST